MSARDFFWRVPLGSNRRGQPTSKSTSAVSEKSRPKEQLDKHEGLFGVTWSALAGTPCLKELVKTEAWKKQT